MKSFDMTFCRQYSCMHFSSHGLKAVLLKCKVMLQTFNFSFGISVKLCIVEMNLVNVCIVEIIDRTLL